MANHIELPAWHHGVTGACRDSLLVLRGFVITTLGTCLLLAALLGIGCDVLATTRLTCEASMSARMVSVINLLITNLPLTLLPFACLFALLWQFHPGSLPGSGVTGALLWLLLLSPLLYFTSPWFGAVLFICGLCFGILFRVGTGTLLNANPPESSPSPEADHLITLLRTAEDFPLMRHRLLLILDKPRAEREVELYDIIDHMRLEGASEEIFTAMAYLTDDAIARKAITLLRT